MTKSPSATMRPGSYLRVVGVCLTRSKRPCGTWESRVEATSLTTLLQMVEGTQNDLALRAVGCPDLNFSAVAGDVCHFARNRMLHRPVPATEAAAPGEATTTGVPVDDGSVVVVVPGIV